MKIKITEVAPCVTEKYPYTNRVEVTFDPDGKVKAVNKWLEENEISNCQTSWGVYYLNKENTAWFLMRWSA